MRDPRAAAVSTHRTRCSTDRRRTARSGLMGLIPPGRMAQTVHSNWFASRALRISSTASVAGSKRGTSKPSIPISLILGRRARCERSSLPVQANALTPIFISRYSDLILARGSGAGEAQHRFQHSRWARPQCPASHAPSLRPVRLNR